MRLATFTVLPQMSYWGLRAPITPATTGPMLRPKIKVSNQILLPLYLGQENHNHPGQGHGGFQEHWAQGGNTTCIECQSITAAPPTHPHTHIHTEA